MVAIWVSKSNAKHEACTLVNSSQVSAKHEACMLWEHHKPSA